jgi:hydroxymethylbilane synthase
LTKVRIICRNSRLSLLQAELVKQKLVQAEPGLVVEIIGRSSRGDRELQVSLSSLDGTDFFTEDIFNALANNEADIAVHSLKDMSAPHFLSHQAFAIVDRDDVRDVALFNPTITDKIKAGETIVIGTCSPRREEMAINFLKKALPQLGEITIVTKSIRGNVEGRLKQLDEGLYDATILATAGLNRLLKAEQHSGKDEESNVDALLKNKKLMLLPLFECVPAPCQGAIVAEAHPQNAEAVELLRKINLPHLFAEAYDEKQKAFEYGTGCLQKFGVTTIRTKSAAHLYAAGEDENGKTFQQWTQLPQLNIADGQLFSSTDCMKEFFEYEWNDEPIGIKQSVVFVANYKSLAQAATKNALQAKTVWAAGTKTWLELAKLGVWVEGSADALGFESLQKVWQMPLLQINRNDSCMLTHTGAAKRWNAKGYQAISNYTLKPRYNETIIEKIQAARFLFWSSFSQYEYYGRYAAYDATHICAGGETASLLEDAGVRPVVFPTIKAFEQWRRSSIRLRSVA